MPPSDTTWTHKGVAVRVSTDAPRKLEWEVYLPATPTEVWDSWTTESGLVEWAGPGAFIDLRVGGAWEVHFEPDRPKGQRGSDANEIVDLEPGRMLRLAAGAPPDFPTVRAEKTDFAVMLEQAGIGHTKVTVIQSGWGQGEEWDRAFDYLAGANAEWLSWLVRRYDTGPLEWPG